MKGSLFLWKVPIFPCFRLMYALKITSQVCMPAICIECRLCEVEFILVFCQIITITPSFSTCFLLWTFYYHFGLNMCFCCESGCVATMRNFGYLFGRSGSPLGPYSMKNWVPIWSLFQWSEVPKWIGCSGNDLSKTISHISVKTEGIVYWIDLE